MKHRSPSSSSVRLAPSTKRGAALVMVLVALAVCVSMVFVAQQLQAQRNTGLRIVEADAKLRHDLLLLLQESMLILASDTNLMVDTPQEDWATPRTGISSNGCAYHLAIFDAQAKFDMNNLSLPEETSGPRTPVDVAAELLVRCGRITEDQTLEALKDWMDADDEGIREESWYRDDEELRVPVNRPLYTMDELAAFSDRTRMWMESQAIEQNQVREYEARFPDEATVIPIARREPIKVNLNSASHDLLIAIFGDGNRAWADTVVQTRSNGPLMDLKLWFASMDPTTQRITRQWFTVRSRVFEVRLRAYYEGFARELDAVLYRGDGGEVEILQCQW